MDPYGAIWASEVTATAALGVQSPALQRERGEWGGGILVGGRGQIQWGGGVPDHPRPPCRRGRPHLITFLHVPGVAAVMRRKGFFWLSNQIWGGVRERVENFDRDF